MSVPRNKSIMNAKVMKYEYKNLKFAKKSIILNYFNEEDLIARLNIKHKNDYEFVS